MRLWLIRLTGGLVVLALGVALGAGPLQKNATRREDELDAQRARVASLHRTIAAMTASGAYSSDFAKATAVNLVRGTLAGRSVALIALPGATAETLDALRTLLTAAGAEVTADVTFAPVMARATSRQLVEALTSQMVAGLPKLDVPADASGYQRFGILLARAVGVPAEARKKDAPYDTTSVGIISGLVTASLLKADDVRARAALTLVVTGPAERTAAAAGSNAVPASILAAYAATAPTVVAGPSGAAGELGVLGALRAAGGTGDVLSTVDTTEQPAGRVAAVLALAALARDVRGSWGSTGATDGVVPPLP